MNTGKLAVVMSGFPRCSETFAIGELLALKNRGLLGAIFSTKAGDGVRQPGVEHLLPLLHPLPDADENSQAASLAKVLKDKNLKGIHGYFAHRPTTVAMKAAKRLCLPYSFSTHARDARKLAPQELNRRVENAACVIACNQDVANQINRINANVYLLPHGVNLDRFTPTTEPESDTFQMLAVGRLVEKKGFDVLIRAVANLKFNFRLRIIGEGAEREKLSALIRQMNLSNRVKLCGALTHNQLPEEFRKASVVIVPSVIDSTGDRDGLPNVILEAMASARAVIASDVSAIRTAIIHQQTGLLVREKDVNHLRETIESLAPNRAIRQSLGNKAREYITANFALQRCSEKFCDLLERIYG
ncbi:MAG: glycosyltransferase [Acidobacteriota bacterium]